MKQNIMKNMSKEKFMKKTMNKIKGGGWSDRKKYVKLINK